MGTPLMKAVQWKQSYNVCEILLTNRADINAQDNAGRTPLDWAEANEGMQTLAQQLRQAGGEWGDKKKFGSEYFYRTRYCRKTDHTPGAATGSLDRPALPSPVPSIVPPVVPPFDRSVRN